jgi:hypothetical protein
MSSTCGLMHNGGSLLELPSQLMTRTLQDRVRLWRNPVQKVPALRKSLESLVSSQGFSDSTVVGGEMNEDNLDSTY